MTSPREFTKTSAVRPGRAAAISATCLPRSNCLPPYRYRSTASSTLGVICANRSITLAGPKSGEHDDQMAPRLAVASNPISAAGMFGRYAATRSPLVTPSAWSPARTRATSAASSP